MARRARASRRLTKITAWIVGLAIFVWVLSLLGFDIHELVPDLWVQIKAIPPGYLIGALVLQSAQTILTGLSYYGILNAAYPDEVTLRPIITTYAVGVAGNCFLPANLGTLITLVMFVAIIPSCTFGGAIAAYLVQKIFFTIAGTFVYLYMFLSVPGAFDISFGNEDRHKVLVAVDRRRRRIPDRHPRPDLLAPGEEALGTGQAGRRDPLAPKAVHVARLPAVLPRLLCKLGVVGDLPGRVRDPRHIRLDHVGRRLRLARERRVVHARRRRSRPRRRTRLR